MLFTAWPSNVIRMRVLKLARRRCDSMQHQLSNTEQITRICCHAQPAYKICARVLGSWRVNLREMPINIIQEDVQFCPQARPGSVTCTEQAKEGQCF